MRGKTRLEDDIKLPAITRKLFSKGWNIHDDRSNRKNFMLVLVGKFMKTNLGNVLE